MPQTVTITLTTAGTDTGPFDLYSDADFYSIPFEIGISKAALILGYVSTIVPNAATIIRVQSTGACSNFIDLNIVTITSTSTTSTSSTSTTTSSTTTVSTTSTTTTAYCPEGDCLGYTATGEGNPNTVFWYIDCNGVYTEQTIDMNDVFAFCACDKPDQYSLINVTISPTGPC